MITTIRRELCSNGINCPALHRRETGRVIVSGPTVTDPDVLRELALPEHESAIETDPGLFAGMGLALLDLDGLAEFVETHHTRDLFRLETLTYYDVPSDGDDYHRYLQGETDPNAEAKQPWLDRLQADVAAGRRWRRVHALTTPLTDYLRYECEWGYVYNVAGGEDVRISEGASEALLGVGDFFVLDGEHVARSHYDQAGRFVGAEVIKEASAKGPYLAIADMLWRTAEPFTNWWEQHPEYHRSTQTA